MPKQSITDLAAAGRSPETTQPVDSALPRPRSGPPGSSYPDSRAGAFGHRGPRALLWLLCTLALGTLLVRVSLSVGLDADAANKALQGWDLLHGHVLLPGWITGDATFYALEIPLSALAEAFTGLSPLAMHVEPVIVYLLVISLVLLLGRGSAVGWAARLRALIAAAILLVPLGSPYGISLLIEQPDHIGTSVFLLAAFTLADRPERRRQWVAPCAVLLVCTAGILSDDTVRYVAVPAIVIVCTLRVVGERRLLGHDAGVLLAALAAIPAEQYVRSLMHRFDGYWMTRPVTGIAANSTWPSHLHRTLRALAALYGLTTQGSPWPELIPVTALGACALTLAFAGFVRVLWLWREVSRAEQLCAIAVVLNLAVYTVSTARTPLPAHEVAVVLPLGAVLGARCLSPAWAWWRAAARPVCAVVVLAALTPAVVSALRPAQPPIPTAPSPTLASWLEGHHLRYGIAGYWDASTLTVDSGGAVAVRAVVRADDGLAMYGWETRQDWYSARLHDATFAVAYDAPTPFGLVDADKLGSADYEALLGRPAAIYRVDGRTVLVYPGNLLGHVASGLPPRDRRE